VANPKRSSTAVTTDPCRPTIPSFFSTATKAPNSWEWPTRPNAKPTEIGHTQRQNASVSNYPIVGLTSPSGRHHCIIDHSLTNLLTEGKNHLAIMKYHHSTLIHQNEKKSQKGEAAPPNWGLTTTVTSHFHTPEPLIDTLIH
jgi:hypothetical protein